MENSSSNSSESPESQTIVITPTQLEKMGLANQLKNAIQAQTQNENQTETIAVDKSNESTADQIDPKNLQKTMKNKLCTLLNHTPLVMQVKDVGWIGSDKKDNLNSNKVTHTDLDDDENAKPKFTIVSNEKLNFSPSEIENMLSSGKTIKSDDAISSPVKSSVEAENQSACKNEKVDIEDLQKQNLYPLSKETVTQSTSQQNMKDPVVLKKQCLKRIQAKMYENLKKVLDEVDSLPVKDKASLSIRPMSDTVVLSNTQSTPKSYSASKQTEKTKDAKENKPCYMSSFRERKTSLDMPERSKPATPTNDDVIIIDADSKSAENLSKRNSEGTPVESTPKIPKKRGRPRKNTSTPIKLSTPEVKDTQSKVIDADNDNFEKSQDSITEKSVRKRRRPKKSIVYTSSFDDESDISESLKETEKSSVLGSSIENIMEENSAVDTVIKSKAENGTEGSLNNTNATPKKRGRPRKIQHTKAIEELNKSEISTVQYTKSTEELNKSEISAIQQESEGAVTPEARTHKKRGRKPKAWILAMEKESEKRRAEKEPEKRRAEKASSSKQYARSKSGRKRKVINYSLLNGDSDSAESEESEVDDRDVIVKSRELVPKKKVVKSVVKVEKISDDEYESSNATKKRVREDKEEETIVIKKMKTTSIENVEEDKGEDIQKTKINAEAIEMKKSVASDNETEIKKEQPINPGEVKCCVCNEVLDEKLWPEHKRKIHNDLAWNNEEEPMDLEDTTIVEEILNRVLMEDTILQCDNCEFNIDAVGKYIEHKKDCRNETISDSLDYRKRRKRKKKSAAGEILSSLFSNITNIKKEEDISDPPAVANVDLTPIKIEQPKLEKDQTQCAVCQKILQKNQWSNHKQSIHNNLAWRIGDIPLDLNDRQLVVRILQDLYAKKKPLFCDICRSSRKSVIGFLSHKSQCQKSIDEISDMKVTCKLCDRRMLPVSLSRHMVLSHSTPEHTKTDAAVEDTKDTADESIGGKRKAAHKAVQLIQNFKDERPAKIKRFVRGVRFRSMDEVITKFNEAIQNYQEATCVFENCTYTTTDAEDLFQHLENCMEKCEDGYTCNYCLATFKLKRTVKEHLSAFHENEDNEDIIMHDVSGDEGPYNDIDTSDVDEKDDELFDNCNKQSNTVKMSARFLANTRKKPINSCYPYAYKWTLEYHENNCSTQNVFPDIIPNKNSWKQLKSSHVFDYLPKLKRSIDFARISIKNIKNPIESNYDWINYKLFESNIDNDGTSTIFCGGPVSAMCWLPTPYNEPLSDQILAVSAISSPDKKYFLVDNYRDKGLIQFWNYGPLNNKEIAVNKPILEFCIAHDFGVIWSMEWCPSGCYDNNKVEGLKKMGLLAVTSSCGFVYIYTILKPKQLHGKIFEVVPTFKLILENEHDQKLGDNLYQATKISWSKVAGHSYIAVGYSNGAVGIFNLNTKSKLLKYVADNIINLKPIQKFKPHYDSVTALVLHHLNEGKRWLVTGSLDRESKLWDLKNTSEPLSSFKKFIITDAIWSMHWLFSVYAYDHATLVGSVPSALIPVRNFNGGMTTFLPSHSRVTSISCNDWGNLFIQANDNGEVVCGFPDQQLQNFDIDKRKTIKKCRILTSYTGYVAKKLSVEERQQVESCKMAMQKKKGVENLQVSYPEPRSYSNVCDNYGLVLCDLDMSQKKVFPSEELDKLIHNFPYHSLYKPDIYPIQTINKVVLNPNRNSFLYYACGYQIGLVRTSVLNFLNN